jgi:PAS domain-containing protein
MTADAQSQLPSSAAIGPPYGVPSQARVVGRLRTLTNSHIRSLVSARRRRHPAISLDAMTGTATVRRLPRSHVVRSAYGLTSFVGLLAFDGTLLEANQSATTPLELSACDALDRPFWEAGWWSWSPIVQQRLREAVARVGAGEVMRYAETALVRRNQLITVDLAWAPQVRADVVTGLICSVIDLTGRREQDSRPLEARAFAPDS